MRVEMDFGSRRSAVLTAAPAVVAAAILAGRRQRGRRVERRRMRRPGHRRRACGGFSQHRMHGRANRLRRRNRLGQYGIDRSAGRSVGPARLSQPRWRADLHRARRPQDALERQHRHRRRRQLERSDCQQWLFNRQFFQHVRKGNQSRCPASPIRVTAATSPAPLGTGIWSAGFYCELVPSDSPVSEARIDQMTGKIKADMF